MSEGYRFEVGQRVKILGRGVVGAVAQRSVELDRMTGRADRMYLVDWIGEDRRERSVLVAEQKLVSAER